QVEDAIAIEVAGGNDAWGKPCVLAWEGLDKKALAQALKHRDTRGSSLGDQQVQLPATVECVDCQRYGVQTGRDLVSQNERRNLRRKNRAYGQQAESATNATPPGIQHIVLRLRNLFYVPILPNCPGPKSASLGRLKVRGRERN